MLITSGSSRVKLMQLLVYPVTVFCLGMPEMQVSHRCIQTAENSICYVV